MAKIRIAQNAGFCFGVKKATDELNRALRNAKPGEKIYTLGHLIHNETYNRKLLEKGVKAIDEDELEELAKSSNPDREVTVLVRAHGCTKQVAEKLNRLSCKNKYFHWIDCTCPFVKKIHQIATDYSGQNHHFLLVGAKDHPEVKGIMSYFEGEKSVVESKDAIDIENMRQLIQENGKNTPIMVAQTTQNLVNWHQSQKNLKKLCTNAIIFDTICSVTETRQKEAEELSKECDSMIVIGGRSSSNTAKLYEICLQNCKNTIWIASAEELDKDKFSGSSYVGIVAGASTPRDEIEEVYKTMSEMNENFAELLEANCATIHTGDIVTGTVTFVSDAELQLDLGTSVTGIIKADQITDDAAFKLTEHFKKGDEVTGFVIRVSDIEGVAELSKKRVDADQNWLSLVAACEEKATLEGVVKEAVKGGVVILCNSNRVFVPASQTDVPKDGNLNELVGKKVSFRVIEIKPGKKAIGSIRVIAREERAAKTADFWANIEVGKVYTGVVKSTTPYGAFVDLGGVDGMVHLTELSWKKIHKPEDVVAIGDVITVFVKSYDPEKKRISLGYKKDEENPWNIFRSQYAIGDVASVKIVNLMPFGAFAEVIDGVDGLIHISQIARERIEKPADVLTVGQVVDARIIDIDEENQKISLSIRSILDEQAAAAEAMPEDYAPVEEVVVAPVEEAPVEEVVVAPVEEVAAPVVEEVAAPKKRTTKKKVEATEDVAETPKKTTRKKAADAEATAEEKPAPKKRTTKKKVEETPVEG